MLEHSWYASVGRRAIMNRTALGPEEEGRSVHHDNRVKQQASLGILGRSLCYGWLHGNAHNFEPSSCRVRFSSPGGFLLSCDGTHVLHCAVPASCFYRQKTTAQLPCYVGS